MSSPHYCLHVKRLENLQWKSRLHAKTPNLYVEVKLGADVKTTRAVKKSSAPVWNEELTFSPSDDINTFRIRVLHASQWSRDVCLGEADIPITNILAASASGEACFDVYRQKSTERSGTIVLSLQQIDATRAAGIEVNNAEESIERSGIGHSTQASDAMNAIDGVTRLSTGGGLYKPIGELLERLDTLKKAIDVVSEMHPFLAIAWKVTSGLLEAVKHVFDTDKKLVKLAWIMKDAYDFSCDTLSLPDKTASLEKSISGLLKQTIECCFFIEKYTKENFVGRMLDTSSSDKVDEFEESLTRYKSDIELGVSLYTAFASVRMLDGIDEILLHQRLEPSPTDSSNRSRSVCLEGTRTEILMEISNWMFSDTDQNIFWLHGVAGCGKSTISMTIAERFRDMSVLGGSLMFERGKSNPSSVIRTIAYKLALHDSRIASQIANVMKEDKDIIAAIPATQFEKLLVVPLSAVADSLPGPVAFVLDALDECGTAESRRDLVQLFRHKFVKLPKKFRFLITSRRENDIDKALLAHPETAVAVELDYTSTGSQEDVLSYLRTEIETIVTEQVDVAATNWNWDESVALLGKAAGGLFIFASTAVRMISASDNPFRALKKLVSNTSSVAHFGLNELYDTILHQSGIVWGDDESKTRFTSVLALVLMSKRPLTSKTMDGILGFSPEEPSLLVLSRLRCLLSYSPGGSVSLFHTSFYDYLTSPERVNDPWYIDISAQQHFIASRCFSVMEDMLHFNMCSLESSFVGNEDVPGLADRVKDCIPAHLEYACLYWSGHLCESQCSSDLIDMLLEFAHERLLFWFEALSLMAAFSRYSSPELADAAVWAEPHNADLSTFLKDASRLALGFSLPVMQSTPHIYTTMIPLTSDESNVSSLYSKRMSNLVRVEQYGIKQSSACLKVLEGHFHSVMSIAVSPNGSSIASASWDETVRVRHIPSGEEALTLRHDSPVISVCFSPNGARLASGCDDGAVRIWDALEGRLILGPLKRHTREVSSVAYSLDGTKIASGSFDKTGIIWDALSGLVLAVLDQSGHSGCVRSVAFSADSSQIASGSHDKTLRIWGVAGELVFDPLVHPFEVESVAFCPTFKCITSGCFDGISVSFSADGSQVAFVSSTLRIWDVATGEFVPFIHPFGVLSAAFCPTSKRIASGCWDENVRIWDTENWNLVSVFETAGRSHCVVYSSCGTRVVSGSEDGTVTVWDASSGHVVSTFKGHSDNVRSVGFTPDGKYIVSGSDDRTVRIWDAEPRQVDHKETVNHTSVVISVAFSPCGQWIASASYDTTIIIWNARTGEAVMGPLRGHTEGVRSVTFSSDGSQLVSGSDDRTIRIWDVESGKPVGEALKGHTNAVNCVALSPDGVQIVSGSDDDTIRVWDMAERKLVAGPLLGHSNYVSFVAFSSDSTHLASGSHDNTIRIWNTKTWETTSVLLAGHKGEILSVCFSPDSTRIASSSADKTVVVWDAETGQIVAGPLKGHDDWVRSVIFLPDGSHLASSSDDGTIRLWSFTNGQAAGESLYGYSQGLTSLALSPDGTRIASGSWDQTVRVWDMPTASRSAQKNSSTVSSVSASSDQDLSDWTLDKDGWVLGGPDHCNLLCWIPHDLRRALWRPQNTAVCAGFSTKLNFTSAALGRRWTECFTARS